MSMTTYAWVAKGETNKAFVLYGGLTGRTVRERIAGGYSFNFPNRLDLVTEGIKKKDIHLLHEEVVGDRSGSASDTSIDSYRGRQDGCVQYSEQIVIDTCRAVADHLEEEWGMSVACGNVKDAVGSYNRNSYDRWVKNSRGGKTYSQKLFYKMIDFITDWQKNDAAAYKDEGHMMMSPERARHFTGAEIVAKNMKKGKFISNYEFVKNDDRSFARETVIKKKLKKIVTKEVNKTTVYISGPDDTRAGQGKFYRYDDLSTKEWFSHYKRLHKLYKETVTELVDDKFALQSKLDKTMGTLEDALVISQRAMTMLDERTNHIQAMTLDMARVKAITDKWK